MKRYLALLIAMVLLFSSLPACASASKASRVPSALKYSKVSEFELECDYFLKRLMNAFSLDGELTKKMDDLVWGLGDETMYRFSWECEEDDSIDLDTTIFFVKSGDKAHVGRFYLMLNVEDSLYDEGPRFEQISKIIYNILLAIMEVENHFDVWLKFKDRLLQYFYEESHKTYRYKHNNVQLILEFDPNDFFVYITLECV